MRKLIISAGVITVVTLVAFSIALLVISRVNGMFDIEIPTIFIAATFAGIVTVIVTVPLGTLLDNGIYANVATASAAAFAVCILTISSLTAVIFSVIFGVIASVHASDAIAEYTEEKGLSREKASLFLASELIITAMLIFLIVKALPS